MDNQTRQIIAAVGALRKMNPADPRVEKISSDLVSALQPVQTVSVDGIRSEIARLHKAAATPAKNYTKILSIATGLDRAVSLSRTADPAVQAKLAALVQKVAGIFAECDTADELASHTLDEIQAAVHRLYNNGKQNDPHTYDFVQRGAGHHSK